LPKFLPPLVRLIYVFEASGSSQLSCHKTAFHCRPFGFRFLSLTIFCGRMGAGCTSEAKKPDGRTDLFPARHKSYFVDDKSAYDPQPVLDRIREVLSHHLLSEMIAIIIECATSLQHYCAPSAAFPADAISIDGCTVVVEIK
jgi:hypothetical protein